MLTSEVSRYFPFTCGAVIGLLKGGKMRTTPSQIRGELACLRGSSKKSGPGNNLPTLSPATRPPPCCCGSPHDHKRTLV
jgi:hypothetical protein